MALPIRGDDGDPIGPDGNGPGAFAGGQAQACRQGRRSRRRREADDKGQHDCYDADDQRHEQRNHQPPE